MTVNPFITDPTFYPTFDQRLQPDRNAGNAMLDYQNALTTKGQLAETVRRATAQAQAADAQRKMQLFQSMSPDELDRIYSGAPQSDAEAEIQRTIAGYENAGNQGFQLGWQSDRQHQIDAEREAELQRHIRDSNQAYGLRENQAKLSERQQALNESYRRDALAERDSQKKEQAQATAQARNQAAVDRDYKNAQNAVVSGSVRSEDDIARLFPSLPREQKAVLAGTLRQIQAESSDVQAQADDFNRQLHKAKNAADMAPRSPLPSPYKDTPWYLPNWAVGAGTGIKDPTAPGYLPNFLVGGGREQVLGPRAQSADELAIIAAGKKEGKGSIIYDPSIGGFVTAPSIARMLPQRPVDVSRNDVRSPQTDTQSGPLFYREPQLQPNPIPMSASVSGNFPQEPSQPGGINYQGFNNRPSFGDPYADSINSQLTPELRQNYGPGFGITGANGKKYVFDGMWFRPR